MNDRQQRFVELYLIDFNATRAAREAGYSERTADRIGYRLLKDPGVALAVEEGKRALTERARFSQDEVLERLWAVASADPRELIEYRRDPCPSCADPEAEFPDDNCPKCKGDGIGRAFIRDTRTLSPQALALYAGVKETKDGVEIRMHDQLKTLEMIGRHLGMFKDGQPLVNMDFTRIERVERTVIDVIDVSE